MANSMLECSSPSHNDTKSTLQSNVSQKYNDDSKNSNLSMSRIKQALLSQLQTTYDRIKQQVLEERDELQKSKKEREDVGVELYGLQQQLSQLQKQLTTKQNDYETLDTKRKREEESISELKCKQKRKYEKYEDIKKQANVKESELEELKAALINVRRFNEATKKEISVSKTVAVKTKEVFEEIQKEKEEQDFYLDSLNEQIYQHEKQISLTKEQLRVQKLQTKEADSMVKAIATDLEELFSEKKQLLQKWNSSLFALGQRDQALDAAVKEFKKTKETLKIGTIEIKRLEKDISQLIGIQETLTLTRNQLQHEINRVGDEIEKIISAKESNEDAIDLLSKTIADTRELEDLEERAVKKHAADVATLNHKIDALMVNYQKVEEDIQLRRAEQASQWREALDYMKEEKKIASAIHESEMESTVVENDLARLQIDLLSTEEQCSHLNTKREVEINLVNELNAKIAIMETNIRRSHDSIQTKMNKVDRLNRKYENMREIMMDEEDEPLGPLEVTIKRLDNAIRKQENTKKSLTSTWSSHQRFLIELIDKCEGIQEKERDYIATLSVLKHQRIRLQQNIHANEALLNMFSSRLKSMHVDISRLNELIGRHTTRQSELSNEISIRKMKFEEEIDSLSNRLVHTQDKIKVIHETKTKTLDDIINEEKEILRLQKNIDLEKEMQAALNSSETAEEIKGMEKEIQRMRHRLEQINRQQEKLLRDIETVIARRSDITVKYDQCKTKRNDSKLYISPITFADVKKKCSEFTKLDENQLKEESKVSS